MRDITATIAMIIGLGVVLVACEGSQPCEVEPLEQGSRIVCPGTDKVIETDEPVDGDCWQSGSNVECTSGETFDVGPESADGSADVLEDADTYEQDGSDVALPDVGRDGSGGAQGPGAWGAGAYGDYRAPCQRVGATEVVCADGRTATVPAEVNEDESCSSEMVAGVGRRVVCGETRVVPDQTEGTSVECTYRQGEEASAITCSDGTIVSGEAVPEEPCEPTIERRGNDVVEVRCGPMLVERELGPCERDWIVENKAQLGELEDSSCTSIHGDIIVRPTRCELEDMGPCEVVATCGEAEPVTVTCERVGIAPPVEGPCRVDATGDVECASGHGVADAMDPSLGSPEAVVLEGVEYIGGDLVIEELGDLVAADARGLVGIGGSLVVRNNPELVELAGFRELEWVTEDISISANPVLEMWTPPLNLEYVDNAFLLSGNLELELVGIQGNFEMPQKLSVGGAGVVTDNGLDWCVAVNLGRFLGARAGASQVYVGGAGATSNQACSFINWR
jgi:hypothetical protein